MTITTPLKKARGLGSAKSGAHHWLMQRITAIALIPLVLWLVCNIAKVSGTPERILYFISSPFNAILFMTFIVISVYHGCLGLRVVIEDYVHCSIGRPVLITLINFISVISVASALLSVVYLHVNTYKGRNSLPPVHAYSESEGNYFKKFMFLELKKEEKKIEQDV